MPAACTNMYDVYTYICVLQYRLMKSADSDRTRFDGAKWTFWTVIHALDKGIHSFDRGSTSSTRGPAWIEWMRIHPLDSTSLNCCRNFLVSCCLNPWAGLRWWHQLLPIMADAVAQTVRCLLRSIFSIGLSERQCAFFSGRYHAEV